MPNEGTVVVVETDDEERERLRSLLEGAGYHVMACPGPSAPEYTCIGGREGYCPLIERADVVVLDTWLDSDEAGPGTSSDELLQLYVNSGRTVVAIGAGASLSPYAGGYVICLHDHPEPSDMLAAVRVAPEPDAFVLRES